MAAIFTHFGDLKHKDYQLKRDKYFKIIENYIENGENVSIVYAMSLT